MIDAGAEVIRALRAGRSVAMHATGSSMGPSIPSGARVRVEPCGATDVSIGDVAAVVSPEGGLTLHRVVAHDRGGVPRTWGDAMPAPDPWPASDVIGRVARVDGARAVGTKATLRALRGRLRVAWHVAIASLDARLGSGRSCGFGSDR